MNIVHNTIVTANCCIISIYYDILHNKRKLFILVSNKNNGFKKWRKRKKNDMKFCNEIR